MARSGVCGTGPGERHRADDDARGLRRLRQRAHGESRRVLGGCRQRPTAAGRAGIARCASVPRELARLSEASRAAPRHRAGPRFRRRLGAGPQSIASGNIRTNGAPRILGAVHRAGRVAFEFPPGLSAHARVPGADSGTKARDAVLPRGLRTGVRRPRRRRAARRPLRALHCGRHATAYEGVLNPGELLFIPADWWHWVRGLEKSITVSHNFFNDVNFSAHVGSMLEPWNDPMKSRSFRDDAEITGAALRER